MTPEEFFITQAASIARSMPSREAALFLRGLVTLCGDCDEVAGLRMTLVSMEENDAQLLLIAGGQLKLNFDNGKDGE